MTNKEYIQKLLDSYMVAETTKEEERLLSDYFCSHQDIPAEWQKFSVMFRGLRQAKTRTIAFHKRTFLKWSAVTAVAASILLLLAFHFTQKPAEEQPLVAEVVEQPAPEVSNYSENSDSSDYSNKTKPSEPIPPQKTYKPGKSVAEPLLTQAEEVPVISADKQALVDIYLAEEALQVAYELQAQQEELRAYAASLTGEEPAKPIIAF